MARRAKKKKRVSKNGSFVVLNTGCGGISQLGAFEWGALSTGHATADLAKAALKKEVDSGGVDNDNTYVIVQIVDVGKPTGMEWTGKTTL